MRRARVTDPPRRPLLQTTPRTNTEMSENTAAGQYPAAPPALPATPAAEPSLLDQIVEQSKVAKSQAEHTRAKDLIGELVNQVLERTGIISDNLSATLDARVAELDRLISSQLSAVMHAPEFQKLESTWRGLDYLCKESNTGTGMKIKAPHAPKRDI